MAITAEELVMQQWDAIYEELKAEMNCGASGPGTGTNPTGRLQTARTISKSLFPDFGQLPFIGIQLIDWDENKQGARVFHQIVAHFEIVACSDIKASGSTDYVSLADAMITLRPILADGLGNGIGPILRDPKNYNLAGTANDTYPKGCKIRWAAKPDSESDYVVFASWNFIATSYIQPT